MIYLRVYLVQLIRQSINFSLVN